MAEKFNSLSCPMCGSELVYSEGTHDLGCEKNPKPLAESSNKREKGFHEQPGTYGSNDRGMDNGTNNFKSYNHFNNKKGDLDSKVIKMCELYDRAEMTESGSDNISQSDVCVFGLSFTESAACGTLWSIRIIDGETNYPALMRLMQEVELRSRGNEPLASNVPNLPKKAERSTASKLAFRYNLELEDLFSIKYSTETIERLAMFYNLTKKEIRHIKQSDILEE